MLDARLSHIHLLQTSRPKTAAQKKKNGTKVDLSNNPEHKLLLERAMTAATSAFETSQNISMLKSFAESCVKMRMFYETHGRVPKNVMNAKGSYLGQQIVIWKKDFDNGTMQEFKKVFLKEYGINIKLHPSEDLFVDINEMFARNRNQKVGQNENKTKDKE